MNPVTVSVYGLVGKGRANDNLSLSCPLCLSGWWDGITAEGTVKGTGQFS